MKIILATATAALACAAAAGTNDVPVIDEPVDSAFQTSFGADLRIREEIMHNVPGLPGAPGGKMMKPGSLKETRQKSYGVKPPCFPLATR